MGELLDGLEVDPGSGRAVFRQIADHLRVAIQDGRLAEALSCLRGTTDRALRGRPGAPSAEQAHGHRPLAKSALSATQLNRTVVAYRYDDA